jgi:type IV pilus assembly protein PilF
VALTNAGLCIERTGGKAKAENFYRKALTANPKYATALYQMAVLLLEQEKYLSARAYLERYHGVAQPTAASLWLGVQIEKQLKGFAKANDYKKQLLKDFPDSPEIQKLYKVEKSQ